MIACVFVDTPSKARRKRDTILKREHGFTHGSICGSPLCVSPEHIILTPWGSHRPPNDNPLCPECGSRSFKIWTGMMRQFKQGNTIFSALHSRRQQYRCQDNSHCFYAGDYLREAFVRLPTPVSGMRPGGFFLGFMSYSSLHVMDIPKQQRCKAKSCAFPANGNGEGLCHHHFHFFDYSVSRLGRHIDMEDIYGNEKQAPRFYVSWFWKHQTESLRFEQGGATSYWKESVTKYQALQTIAGSAPVGVQHGVAGLHHGQGPSKPRVKRSRRKTVGKGMGGHYTKGNHPSQKPEKRWSREELEIQANQILLDSGFFAPSQKHYFDEKPKASPVSYMATESDIDEEQERDLIIADLSKQESEFAEIFGA